MGNSRSLMSYNDVKEILDKALATPKGVELEFPTRPGAIRWLSRANTFRTLDRKNNEKLYPEGHQMYGCSPYDTLHMLRKENKISIRIYTNEEVTITEL